MAWLRKEQRVRNPTYRLWPEYGGAGPLWSAHGPEEASKLGLSGELLAALRRWEQEWLTGSAGMDEETFRQGGRRLAQQVSDELGAAVSYDDEWFTPTGTA
jgi:hypothetical protein